MDAAAIPQNRRAELLQYIRENPLAQPEAMDRLARQLSDVTGRWSDVSHLATNAETSAAQLRHAWAEYRQAVMGRLRASDGSNEQELSNLLRHPDQLRSRLADSPDALRTLDEYVRVRDANARVQGDLHAAASARAAEMETALNNVAADQHLPRVRVQVVDDAFIGDPVALYADGVITLRQSDVLSNRDPMHVTEAAYHEFVHNQQHNLIIRSAIDDVERQLGRPIQPQDFERIRQDLNQRAHDTISDERLAEVLRARNGRELDANERLRADHLTEAWRNGSNGNGITRVRDDLRVTISELHKALESGGGTDLVRRLSEDNGTLAQHLFGGPPPAPIATLVRRAQTEGAGAIDDAAAQDLFRSALSERWHNLAQEQRSILARYLSGFDEREANVAERILTARVREQGIVGAQHAYRAGDRIVSNGQEWEVMAVHGNAVEARRPGPPPELTGPGVPEGQYNLSEYSAIRSGDTTYYRSADGDYYRLNSRRELVQDWDITPQPLPERGLAQPAHGGARSATADALPPPAPHATQFPGSATQRAALPRDVLTAPGAVEAPGGRADQPAGAGTRALRPATDDQGHAQPHEVAAHGDRPAAGAGNDAREQNAGAQPELRTLFITRTPDGDIALVRPAAASPPSGEHISVTPETLQTCRRVGDTEYYADAQGNFYQLQRAADGSQELVRDTQLHVFNVAYNIEVQRPLRYELDPAQTALRDASLTEVGAREGGALGTGLRDMTYTGADGLPRHVIFHPDNGQSHVRLRRELASERIHQMLGLENGFPVTVPREVELTVDGVRTRRSGWVQENSGEPLERQLPNLARERYHESHPDQTPSQWLARLVREDPEVRGALETAFVERMILGDRDPHSGNFVVSHGPDGRLRVQNIDLDFAFEHGAQPRLDLRTNLGINRDLFAQMSGQELSPAVVEHLRNFVSDPGRLAALEASGLTRQEAQGVMARAQWLVDNRRMPESRSMADQLGLRPAPAESRAAGAVQAGVSDQPSTVAVRPGRNAGPAANEAPPRADVAAQVPDGGGPATRPLRSARPIAEAPHAAASASDVGPGTLPLRSTRPGADAPAPGADAVGRPRASGLEATGGEGPTAAAPFEPDSRQRALMAGTVEGALIPMDGGLNNIPPQEIRIRTADGTSHRAVFHPADSRMDERLAAELAVYRLNGEMALDNGFPVTIPRPIEIAGRLGWVQEHGGDRLDRWLQSRGADTSEGARRLLADNPQLREQLQTAWAERMILGDHEELRPGNLVISEDSGRLRVQNIDVENAFSEHNGQNLIPQMDVIAQRGIFANITAELSGQPINPQLLHHLRTFIQRYDNAAELARLEETGLNYIQAQQVLARPLAERTGLTDEQAMRVLARARHLVETGHFPEARGWEAAVIPRRQAPES